MSGARLVFMSAGAGLALGLAGRVLMRLIALESGLPGRFSPGGSLEVVAFGALIGAPVALVFWVARPRIRIPAPWAGSVLGLLLMGWFSLARPPAARSALAGTPDTPLLTWLGFLSVFVLWGTALDYAGARRRD
jgi:hypothetical protein